MTVAVIIAGLIPIMWSEGTGAEIMQRIAAPMIGGMITAPLLSMLVIPAAYLLLRRRSLPAPAGAQLTPIHRPIVPATLSERS
jgi:Cu(I)/Ag(I) efflux system membrane protein CusA/SilA